jgi:hypothetical protein
MMKESDGKLEKTVKNTIYHITIKYIQTKGNDKKIYLINHDHNKLEIGINRDRKSHKYIQKIHLHFSHKKY